MRVIAGNYKGRRLECPKSDKIRPTTDKVKEAMFGALQFDLPGAHVLDAFAGSGALGIEALSRSAAHVDFVEIEPECFKILKHNVEAIAKDGFSIYKGDIFKLITKLKKYNIVLLDPPYDSELYQRFLELSDAAGIMSEGCKVVAECRKKFDFIYPAKYNLIKKKDYGDISLWFLSTEDDMIKCVYPGSFDPVTAGHIDIIERAAALFDEVTIAVLVNSNKTPAFSTEQRIDFIRRSTMHLSNIIIDSFSGLLVDYMSHNNANLVIRGLRAISDFEYEFQMAALNAKLAKNIETVFLMTDTNHSFLSSSLVRELAFYGGDLTGLVPEAIKNDIIKCLAGK